MSLQLTRQKSREDRLARAASGEGRIAGGCRCLPTAKAWLASPANRLHLRLHKSTEDEWIIACPSLSADSDSGLVSFAVTLPLPHGLAVADDGSILEELEAESYDCLFSEDESSHKKRQQLEAAAAAAVAPAAKAAMTDDAHSDSLPPPGPASSKHDGCTVSAILSFAHEFIVKMDSGFGSPAATSAASASARPATAKSPKKRDDDDGFGGDDGAEGGDAFDDGAGFSDDGGGNGDDGDGDGDWGTTEEVDLLDAGVDASSKTMAGTPSPAHARLAVGFSAASVNPDNGVASSSAAAEGGVHVYSKDDIASMQAVMIPRVAGSLCITNSAAILMLRKARWDENACIAKYKADPSGFAKEAGCLGLLREYMAPAPAHGADELFTCGVCYDDEVPWDRTFAMKCGHRFCLSCWGHYIESEIKAGSITGGNALGTKCAGEKCKEGLGQECIELILAYHDSAEEEASHKELLSRYENMLALSFVDDNDHLQWCPAPGCEKVIQSFSKLNTVKCSCGYLFCFKCKLEAHAPANCTEAAAWVLRDKAEANLDTKYLMEQTKPCPKCHVRTKKEGGSKNERSTDAAKEWKLLYRRVGRDALCRRLTCGLVSLLLCYVCQLHVHRVHSVQVQLVLALRPGRHGSSRVGVQQTVVRGRRQGERNQQVREMQTRDALLR